MTIDLVEFRILGPFEVRVDGRTVPLAAPKLRALLAVLLLHANEPLSRDRLIEDLWADRPPATAPKILKTYVSQLRGALGRDAIETVPVGYELRAGPESVDARRFEQLVAEARVAAPPAAVLALREALALWRGPPLTEFAYEPWARPEIARLEELGLEALEERIGAELALGGDSELVAELELLVARHPLRERLRGQLMLALYRSGRQAEALAAYRDARRALVEALGIEPGPSLRRLERAVLDQDPSLDVSRSEQGADGRAQPPRRLRGPSSSFVARKRELRELQTLLRREDVQLLTLTGAAGSGKTCLAVEAARALAADWPQAVLVELAPITDANLVAKTIADELDVRHRPGQTPGEALLDYLRDRRALLLLDNFEHVLTAAPALRGLIAAAPGVKMLVTSRTALGVAHERIYPVPPLEIPDPSTPRTPARLRETEAIRLFCDRAREARSDFGLCAANADAVAEICVRLDGLPLALELAAARTTLLSPRAVVARMGGILDLLKAGPSPGMAERHGTLRAAIEWSYDLLERDLQKLFASLAVFVGGFTLDGAEAVAGDGGVDVLDGVESLLRSNLLTTPHTAAGEPARCSRRSAHTPSSASRHTVTVRTFVAGTPCSTRRSPRRPSRLVGPDQLVWLERLDAERDNLRTAMDWARASGDAELGLRIAAPLSRFSNLRNDEQDARRRIEELLAIGSASPSTTATAQAALAGLAHILGDLDTVQRMLAMSLPVHRRLGNDRWVIGSLGLLSAAALAAGHLDEAYLLAQEELETARRVADSTGESYALLHVGVILAARGDLDDAEPTLGEAVRPAAKLRNARSVAQFRSALGVVALLRGDHARARRLLEQSLAEHRSRSDTWSVSRVLLGLAYLALASGNDETARSHVAESLAFDWGSDCQLPQVADDLEMAARLAAARGQLTRAVTIYASAALLRESVGVYGLGAWFWPDPTPHIAELRSTLGEAEFEHAWAQGRAMTSHDAIDHALDATTEPALTEASNAVG